VVGKCRERDDRAGDPLALEPGLRLRHIAGRRATEREPRHPVGQPAREIAPDGAEAGNADAGRFRLHDCGVIAPPVETPQADFLAKSWVSLKFWF
jgi:hypothetical protein